MPKRSKERPDRTVELLEKLVVLQMYSSGATQDRIAKAVGRQKAWVNELVKGLPKKGRVDGGQSKAKEIKRRPRRG